MIKIITFHTKPNINVFLPPSKIYAHENVCNELNLHIEANEQIASNIDEQSSVKNSLNEAKVLISNSDFLLKKILKNIDNEDKFKEIYF